MNTKIERRSYSLEFKREVFRLAKHSKRPKSQIAKELGGSPAILYNRGTIRIKCLRLEVKQLNVGFIHSPAV